MPSADGVKLEASDKIRDILVVDTTKPICDVKIGKVVRGSRSSISLHGLPALTLLTYRGSKGVMNLATVTYLRQFRHREGLRS